MNRKRQQEVLYAFNLPRDLLESLEPVEKETEALLEEKEEKVEFDTVNALALERLQIQQERSNNDGGDDSNSNVLTCNTCAISFTDREEQRSHFNTDWHRYNIKRRVVLDVKPVSFEEFEVLLQDLTESISGSESEEDFDEDDESETPVGQDLQRDNIHSLVQKQKEQQEEQELLANRVKQVVMPSMRKLSAWDWFKQANVKDSSHYGFYRHLFNNKFNNTTLGSLQQSSFGSKKRTWTIIMLGGGHFAGCVIDVGASKGPGERAVDKQVKIIAHKTFHRYTTRRKQGKSQSTQDSAFGAANSAGAQIRRHNEVMLQQEVRATLSQWRQHIEGSELVLVHAPSNNRKVVFSYEGAVLDMATVKSIPFVTRRPTLNELKRVFLEMTTVKITQVDEAAVQAYRQKWLESQENLKKQLEKSFMQVKKPKQVTEKNIDPDLEKLIALIKQNKTTVTSAFIEKHMNLPLSGVLPEELADIEDLYHYPTVLHLAASMGGDGAELVTELLVKHDADPTIVSEAGKTAYEVSKDKETRNAFRRCMCDYPDKWSWLEEGRVPSPLTEKQLKDQMAKDAKKQAKEQEKERLIELERSKLEAAREAKEEEARFEKLQATRAKNGLLPIVKPLGSNEISDIANMTPEARMRFEREKRARAAERSEEHTV